MASLILKTYLSSDIVEYCILPYLIPPADDVKIIQEEMIEEYHKMILLTKLINIRHQKLDTLMPSDLKSRYLGLAKWCLDYHNHINQQFGKN